MRITRSPAGIVVDGASAGRGAWLCRDADGGVNISCLDSAVQRGGFARAWRTTLGSADIDELRRRTTTWNDEHPRQDAQ